MILIDLPIQTKAEFVIRVLVSLIQIPIDHEFVVLNIVSKGDSFGLIIGIRLVEMSLRNSVVSVTGPICVLKLTT